MLSRAAPHVLLPGAVKMLLETSSTEKLVLESQVSQWRSNYESLKRSHDALKEESHRRNDEVRCRAAALRGRRSSVQRRPRAETIATLPPAPSPLLQYKALDHRLKRVQQDKSAIEQVRLRAVLWLLARWWAVPRGASASRRNGRHLTTTHRRRGWPRPWAA